MQLRFPISLLLIAGTGLSQVSQVPTAVLQRNSVAIPDVPDTQLEAAQKANPDNMRVAARLLQYLGQDRRDLNWSSRGALLSWYVEHHPDAPFFGFPSTYAAMPEALRSQLKQAWITQVHQHADNPVVLQNAALAMNPPAPTQIRVGGKVQESNLISQAPPEYPAIAKEARVQGTVKMNVTIDPEGQVTHIELVSGHPLLVQAALSAVQKYRYRPTLLNGQPVTVMTTVDVSFTLNG